MYHDLCQNNENKSWKQGKFTVCFYHVTYTFRVNLHPAIVWMSRKQSFADVLQNRCVQRLQACSPATLLKRDSNKCVFCEICEIFKNNFFLQNDDCFLNSLLKTGAIFVS